jgi:hypothetical protein
MAPRFAYTPSQATLQANNSVFARIHAWDAPIPPWATASPFFSVTRTEDEFSVVCQQDVVPEGVACERGWRCLRVAGALPLSAVGILARLTALLAEANVSALPCVSDRSAWTASASWRRRICVACGSPGSEPSL